MPGEATQTNGTAAATAASVVAAAVKPGEVSPPKVEVAAPVKPVEDPRIAAQLKKEQELVGKQQAFSAEREAFRKQQAEYAEYKQRQANALRDPDSFLKPIYGDKWIEKLNEYRLNANQVTPELIDAHVERRFSALEEQRNADKAKLDAEQKAESERTEKEWSDGTVQYVKDNASTYELIEMNGAHTLVPQTIKAHYAQTGKILSPKEAADLVESEIEKQIEKNLASKKWQARTAKPGERPGSNTATLTNGHTASTSRAEVVGSTEKDRMDRAIKVAEEYEQKAKARAQQAAS